jgi:hypothetical protein
MIRDAMKRDAMKRDAMRRDAMRRDVMEREIPNHPAASRHPSLERRGVVFKILLLSEPSLVRRGVDYMFPSWRMRGGCEADGVVGASHCRVTIDRVTNYRVTPYRVT